MKKVLEHPIFSSVIASLIILFLTWIGSFIPNAETLHKFLLSTIPVPAWLVLFFSIFIFFSIFLLFFLTKSSKRAKKVVIKELSLLEKQCLQMHVGLEEDYGIVPSQVVGELSIHVDEAKYTLEKLKKKRYIRFKFFSKQGEEATELDDLGREYVVKHKLYP
ncbi:hypothetical protein ACVBE9_12200 [Eionea flava]